MIFIPTWEGMVGNAVHLGHTIAGSWPRYPTYAVYVVSRNGRIETVTFSREEFYPSKADLNSALLEKRLEGTTGVLRGILEKYNREHPEGNDTTVLSVYSPLGEEGFVAYPKEPRYFSLEELQAVLLKEKKIELVPKFSSWTEMHLYQSL